MSSAAAAGQPENVVVRVRPGIIRMARALVHSAQRDGEPVDPIVAKIADAAPPSHTSD